MSKDFTAAAQKSTQDYPTGCVHLVTHSKARLSLLQLFISSY